MISAGGQVISAGGNLISTPGSFTDNFDRGADGTFRLGNGWINLSDDLPAAFEPAGIYNGTLVCANARSREDFGTTYIDPESEWVDYQLYPPGSNSIGGIGGAYRDIGSTSYDITVRMGGILEGDGMEAEFTPLVGLNLSEPGIAYGAWLVSLGDEAGPWAFLVGKMGDTGEDFDITHVSSSVAHTSGTPRDLTIKYRATNFTVWLDGVQISLSTYPGFVSIGTTPVTVEAGFQNSTLGGFEFDTHLIHPTTITPTISCGLNYAHNWA